jgi:hypothetical protein
VSYAVALVLDPEFGTRLKDLAGRMHAWVVESPGNVINAKAVWDALPTGEANTIEAGVTLFKPFGRTREDWCIGVIDRLDLHHNDHSHVPGYTILEVIGVDPSEAIQDEFAEFGFSEFIATVDGFVARKDGA